MPDVQSHLIESTNLIEACQSSYRLLKLRHDMNDVMAKSCSDDLVARAQKLRWHALRIQEHMYSTNPSGNVSHEHEHIPNPPQYPYEEKQ